MFTYHFGALRYSCEHENNIITCYTVIKTKHLSSTSPVQFIKKKRANIVRKYQITYLLCQEN